MLPRLESPQSERLGPSGATSLLPEPGSIQSSSTALVLTNMSSRSKADDPMPIPYLNFGLSAEDAKLLFEQLPEVSAEFKTSPDLTALRDARVQKDLIDEKQKAESMKRILDLTNANSRGIRFENTRRIVRRFGQGEGTGRCEVQGTQHSLPLDGTG